MSSNVIAAIDVANIYNGDEQRKDTRIAELIWAPEDGETVNGEFQLIEDVLCKKNFDLTGKKWLPVIPKHLRQHILQCFHDASTTGHLGFIKTHNRIRKRFHWPGLYRNVLRKVGFSEKLLRKYFGSYQFYDDYQT